MLDWRIAGVVDTQWHCGASKQCTARVLTVGKLKSEFGGDTASVTQQTLGQSSPRQLRKTNWWVQISAPN